MINKLGETIEEAIYGGRYIIYYAIAVIILFKILDYVR